MKNSASQLNIMALGLSKTEMQQLEAITLSSNWREISYRVRQYLPYEDINIVLVDAENTELLTRLGKKFSENVLAGKKNHPICILLTQNIDKTVATLNDHWTIFKAAIPTWELIDKSAFLDSLDSIMVGSFDEMHSYQEAAPQLRQASSF